MSFPRYERYKDSGVSWLGKVPEHWQISALKRIANLQSGETIGPEAIEPVGEYPVYGGNGLRGFTSTFTHNGNHALIGRQGALCGNVNYASGEFWASEHAIVVTPIQSADTTWLGELLREMNLNQYSIASAQPGLSVDNIRKLLIAVPTLAEQQAIGHFLRNETAKIDALIEEQRRLIELLKEKRQAVISHAVTKGLNPDAPMKDSEVEWMASIPVHWRVLSLGRITESACDGPFGSGLKSDHYVDAGIRVIRLQNIRDGVFDGTDAAFIDPVHYADLGDHDVISKDLLIAGLGDERNAVGRACVAPSEIEPAMVKADCFRFRLTHDALPEFVAAQLSIGAPTDSGRLATGSTRSRIPVSKMSSRPVAIPSVEEQSAIVSYLGRRDAEFAGLRSQAELGINLLQERRSALISAAVTGKIDVRSYTSKEAA